MKIKPILFILALCAAISASAAQKIWTGAAGDTLWSNGANWSAAGMPGATDNVVFTNLDFVDSSFSLGGAANNQVDSGFGGAINSLGYMNINGYHNTTVTKPLTVAGVSASNVAFVADDGRPAVFFIGSGKADGAGDSVYASIAGSSLTVNNPNADLSVMQLSATSGSHRATLDLTGLNSFICTVSNVLVGHDFGVPVTRPNGTLILATTNAITAKLISVSDAYQNAGTASFIHLGQNNALNVDRLRIALHKCVGTVDFQTGLTAPSVKFRNAAGTGRQTSWEVGDEYEPDTTLGYFTSNQSIGILDLTGGNVDAMVDRITLGRGQTNALTRTGDGNGSLIFGGGTIDANSVELGVQLSDGGSVGHGILTVNMDDGVNPAKLIVHGNITMAVQLAGNTDASGSSAIIDLNGGELDVFGNVTDGAGSSSISVRNGGVLNLKPAGDTVAGNLSVDTLTLDFGTLTNFAVLSATTINLPTAPSQLILNPGQTLAPAGIGKIGALTILGDFKVRGTTDLDISKNGATLAGDSIMNTGVADLGGTLRVRFTGTSALGVGDKFVILTSPNIQNEFTTMVLPDLEVGLGWADNLLADGSIEVIAIGGEPTDPPTLDVNRTSNALTLSWPAPYSSYILKGQTNSASIGLNTNWGVVSGVVANQISIPFNSSNGSVFFQLFKQ